MATASPGRSFTEDIRFCLFIFVRLMNNARCNKSSSFVVLLPISHGSKSTLGDAAKSLVLWVSSYGPCY
jgi:hypothetical protein